MLGALARLGVLEALPPTAGHWPWATFLVNVAGAFVLGWIVVRVPSPSDRRRLFLGTGFCGALTTFSAMQLELLQMLDAGRIALALLYAGGSVLAGLAAVRVAS